MSILAVWTLTEVWSRKSSRRSAWIWALAAGLCGGLAVLSPAPTGLAILAASGLFALVTHGRKRFGPLLLWGATAIVVIAPWAWMTLQEYGTPFYSYTGFFEYNFSWTVHHYEKGNTSPRRFILWRICQRSLEFKIKSIFLIIVVYSTMVSGITDSAGIYAAFRVA